MWASTRKWYNFTSVGQTFDLSFTDNGNTYSATLKCMNAPVMSQTKHNQTFPFFLFFVFYFYLFIYLFY